MAKEGFRHCGHDQGCVHDFHHNADEYDKYQYLDLIRVAEVGGTWEWGSLKMQGFSENGEPQHLGYFVANLSIVVIYASFERLTKGFQEKSACFLTAFYVTSPSAAPVF